MHGTKMTTAELEMIVTVGGAIIVMLLGTVTFFLTRLIVKVEYVADSIPKQANQIEHLERQLANLTNEIRDIMDLKVSVLVIQKEIESIKIQIK